MGPDSLSAANPLSITDTFMSLPGIGILVIRVIDLLVLTFHLKCPQLGVVPCALQHREVGT